MTFDGAGLTMCGASAGVDVVGATRSAGRRPGSEGGEVWDPTPSGAPAGVDIAGADAVPSADAGPTAVAARPGARGASAIHRLADRVAERLRLERRHVERLFQWVRYGATSCVATLTSMTVLGALVATNTLTPGWANVVATSVGTVPSFELNRRWVWGRTGRRSLAGEVGPFCVMSFAGLTLSTLLVSAAGHWATGAGLDAFWRTAVIEVANVAAFGTLWVAQFVVLDRVLFAHRAPGAGRRAATVPANRIDPSTTEVAATDAGVAATAEVAVTPGLLAAPEVAAAPGSAATPEVVAAAPRGAATDVVAAAPRGAVTAAVTAAPAAGVAACGVATPRDEAA